MTLSEQRTGKDLVRVRRLPDLGVFEEVRLDDNWLHDRVYRGRETIWFS